MNTLTIYKNDKPYHKQTGKLLTLAKIAFNCNKYFVIDKVVDDLRDKQRFYVGRPMMHNFPQMTFPQFWEGLKERLR